MARVAIFDEARILDAAAKLVADKGPSAATMTAIGAALGAPNGSLYHRFKSRDELLARLWLSKAQVFQDRWCAALNEPDDVLAGLKAALSIAEVVREDSAGAHIMLLYRREDFLTKGWSNAMQDEAERLRRQVHDGLTVMTKRLFVRDTKPARRTTTFLTLDLPYAAVRRYVADKSSPPAFVENLIEQGYRAIVEQCPIRDTNSKTKTAN